MKKRRIVLLTMILTIFVLAMILLNTATKEPEHIDSPETCADQWIQDVNTVEETLDCIKDYAKNEQLKKQGQEP